MSESEEVVHSVDKVMGLVGELKLDDIDRVAESECYRNMSAVATALSMEMLAQGYIVNQSIVYGIVATAGNLDKSTLLKLEANFAEAKCKFLKCKRPLQLNVVLNLVVSLL